MIAERSERRWMLKYFHDHKNENFRATVLSIRPRISHKQVIGTDRRATVLFSDLGWTTMMTIPKELKPGSNFYAAVETVEPGTDYISWRISR
jgi:hypothetical protein